MLENTEPGDELPQIAFYYPAPMWREGDWIKNLVLFFDGIALLVPSYMRDRPFDMDPAIATALRDHGLLTILEPETFIDASTAEALVSQLTDLLAAGSLDKLAGKGSRSQFVELSYSRLGGTVEPELADMIIEELEKRGLAARSSNELTVPMHPLVHSTVLVLLAQLLRPTGVRSGLDLQPATDRPQIHRALAEVLEAPSMPSTGHVVSLDLQTVGIDLGPVPIDEILDFRQEHGDKFQKYARSLRKFLDDLSILSGEKRRLALRDRQAEIRAAAAELQEVSNRAWNRPAAFLLGLAGAAWTVKTGDVIGAALALGGTAAATQLAPETRVGAYSYLFDARSQLDGVFG